MSFDPVVGQPFDPKAAHRERIYVLDFVDEISGDTLGDLPKRVYTRMYRLAVGADRQKYPWYGYVYWSIQEHSWRLGRSQSAIRRAFDALKKFRLIQVKRPDRTLNNETYFLWHPDFRNHFEIGREPAPPKTNTQRPASATVNASKPNTAHLPVPSARECSQATDATDRERSLYKGMSPSVSPSEVQECVKQVACVSSFFPPDQHMISGMKAMRRFLETLQPGTRQEYLEGLAKHVLSELAPGVSQEQVLDAYEERLLTMSPTERWSVLSRFRSLDSSAPG